MGLLHSDIPESVDAIVIDDEPNPRNIIAEVVGASGLSVRSFEHPWDAIQYLSRLREADIGLPYLYLCDMKIFHRNTSPMVDYVIPNDLPAAGGVPIDSYAPQMLLDYIEHYGIPGKFYFMTGTESPFDKNIANSRGVQIIRKEGWDELMGVIGQAKMFLANMGGGYQGATQQTVYKAP